MADRRETHFWTDGQTAHLYSERAADIRRFEEWIGPPTRRGRGGACAHWDDLPGDALRIRRKVQRGSRTTAPSSIAALKAARTARQGSGAPAAPQGPPEAAPLADGPVPPEGGAP